MLSCRLLFSNRCYFNTARVSLITYTNHTLFPLSAKLISTARSSYNTRAKPPLTIKQHLATINSLKLNSNYFKNKLPEKANIVHFGAKINTDITPTCANFSSPRIIMGSLKRKKLIKAQIISKNKHLAQLEQEIKLLDQKIISDIKPTNTNTKNQYIAQLEQEINMLGQKIISNIKPTNTNTKNQYIAQLEQEIKMLDDKIISDIKPTNTNTKSQYIAQLEQEIKLLDDKIISDIKPTNKNTKNQYIAQLEQEIKMLDDKIISDIKPTNKNTKNHQYIAQLEQEIKMLDQKIILEIKPTKPTTPKINQLISTDNNEDLQKSLDMLFDIVDTKIYSVLKQIDITMKEFKVLRADIQKENISNRNV
ncbi:hypothetical protein BB561_000839 [Smittium simulii]|uniref:Uncharacterized protein n=1 Tax=Smittium simulii TaxID=133385 RepID=A0A2T9YXD1_9FUNG|nr:hypothetical protein BB561_000839 [Smittium simulii]